MQTHPFAALRSSILCTSTSTSTSNHCSTSSSTTTTTTTAISAPESASAPAPGLDGGAAAKASAHSGDKRRPSDADVAATTLNMIMQASTALVIFLISFFLNNDFSIIFQKCALLSLPEVNKNEEKVKR